MVPPPFVNYTKPDSRSAYYENSVIRNCLVSKRKRPPVKAPKAAREQDGRELKSPLLWTLSTHFPNLATRRAALAGEHLYSISARAEKAWKRGCRRTLSHAFSAGFPARPETKNPRCRHLGFPSTAKTKSIPSKTRPEPSEHSCVTTATWKQ